MKTRDEDDHLRSKPIDAFVGVSSTAGPHEDERPTLRLAMERAAQLASENGYAGQTFHMTIEIVPEAHNQWIRTFRAIITPES